MAPKPLFQAGFRDLRLRGTFSIRSPPPAPERRLSPTAGALGLAISAKKPETRMKHARQLWQILIRDTVWKRWLRFVLRRHKIT
jgi:hypothetical protein